jgi:hypothetical protein
LAKALAEYCLMMKMPWPVLTWVSTKNVIAWAD